MTTLLLAAVLAMAPFGGATAQPSQIVPLSSYIDSLHWDSAKSGTLIAIESYPAGFSYYGPGTKLSDFGMKMVRAGKLSVIALSWTTALKDEDIPNAYQALTDEEKICFLLSTLSPSDLSKLTGRGLSASELSGEQSAALLSLIPNPLRYLQGTAQAMTFRSEGDPVQLPDDQRAQVRLQLHRGVEVSYAMGTLEGGGNSYSTVDSLRYRGSTMTPAVMSAAMAVVQQDVKLPGRVVDSAEKKSDLAWTDARLARSVTLTAKNQIGSVVDSIRASTGIDIYADARIEAVTFDAYGDHASAGDLLHGLAIAVGGTVRRVGSAYILTADQEGTAARSARLKAHISIGAMEIEARVAGWRSAAKRMNLTQALSFPSGDAFQGGSVPARDFAPPGSSFESNWVPISDLPSDLQSALNVAKGANQGGTNPAAGFEGKAKVTSMLGYCLVLPDGRPQEFHSFDPAGTTMVSTSTVGATRQQFPVELKTLHKGTAVAIKSDDPQSVTKLCTTLKEFKISELWLESLSPAAVKAAVDAGFTVNLVVRPWHVTKGESCPEPDRNQVGQTGSQLNAIPAAKINPVNQRTESYADSFSPAAKEASAHIDRIAKISAIPGIHNVVLLDAEPGGYRAPVGESNRMIGDMTINGVLIHPGLPDKTPGLYEFGFTTDLRAAFIRSHHMDPVDIDQGFGESYGPVSPYFQSLGFGAGAFSLYPQVHFPNVAPISDGLLENGWEAARREPFLKRYAEMVKSFSDLGKPLYVEGFATRNDPIATSPIWFVAERGSDGKPDPQGETNIRYVSVNPLNAEDEAGNLDFNVRPIPTDLPFCFDLTEVPANRIVAYLRYLLKP